MQYRSMFRWANEIPLHSIHNNQNIAWDNAPYRFVNIFILIVFLVDTWPFMGQWYNYIGSLVTSPMSFKVKVGSLIHTWQKCIWCTFPEIYLWCDTCQPLDGQHSNQPLFFISLSAEIGYQIQMGNLYNSPTPPA